MRVGRRLNAEVRRCFRWAAKSVRPMQPGVYVMTADVKGSTTDSYDPISTQWFHRLRHGSLAYQGLRQSTVFINSLASTEPLKGQIEVRADVAQG